ncbi:uncharacterized protein LOC117646309 [Thrips palmi]|uniref:Uncharacterized protein LOC117646309 n=1 Tax=Thrips palmi TaxID=161013 RepID=A0A6P8Z0D3_THRPL|nr:uncharacterized protein LOC117646309 [Thrips palmi]
MPMAGPMAGPSVSLTLPQMVDLALGSPEVGSVNFNILHSLLHVMIKQLELQQCAVEFRGPDSERIQAAMAGSASASAVPVAKLSDYRVRDRSLRRDREVARRAQQHDDSESSRTVGPLPRPRPRPRRRCPAFGLYSSASRSSSSGSDGPSAKVGKARSRKGCRRCSGVDEAEEVLRAAHSRKKRFSAHLLEVLTSSHRLERLERLERLSEDAASLQSSAQLDATKSGVCAEGTDVGPPSPKRRARLDKLQGRTEAVESRVSQGENRWPQFGGLCLAAVNADSLSALLLADDRLLLELRNKMAVLPPTAATAGHGAGSALAVVDVRGILNDLAQQGRSLGVLQSEQRQLAARLDGLDALASGLSRGIDQGLALADGRLQAMQVDLDSAATHLGTLFRDRDHKSSAIKGLQERVHTLEQLKADRWQLEAALAEKADRGLVSAKVSHTEFTAACTNIHNDLGQAKTKLTETETRLDSKLDRDELPAMAAELAERVEKLVSERPSEQLNLSKHSLGAASLLLLQQQQAQALQAEHFAAATKVRLIRNLTCISCDGPRAMRCDDWCPAVPTCESFPERRPTRPYMAGMPCQASPPPRGASGAGEGPAWAERPDAVRLVTRFCGGSHTVTPVGARVAVAHRERAHVVPLPLPSPPVAQPCTPATPASCG